MRLSHLLSVLTRLLIPPALIFTTYLYLYPAAHGCAFPGPTPAEEAAWPAPGQQEADGPPAPAPFRLLALGDPQLEGDTSLPDPDAPLFPSLRAVGAKAREGDVSGVRAAARDFVRGDVGRVLRGYRKRLDLWGNDRYLAHIYRSVSWWTRPTHTVVLGDLLGSQWIGDEEFRRRSDRFWRGVFRGGEKVPRSVTDVRGGMEVLGEDGSWRDRIIAVAGNHDIGYAGDIHERRIERFEDAYGRVNWDITFRLGSNTTHPGSPSVSLGNSSPESGPALRVVVLNSMNLDDPALRSHLQQESRDFVDRQFHVPAQRSPTEGTILLTHIPFHKEAGVCVDAPFFSYFPRDQGGGIREQNHLSEQVTGHVLDGLTRPGQGQAIVLNGHDHEGCDTYHSRETHDPAADTPPWHAKPHRPSAAERADDSRLGVREVTVRSMMGSFGGNAGLLSAWYDRDVQGWRYEYAVCALGVQHIWWAVHVLDLVALGLGLAAVVAGVVEASLPPATQPVPLSGDGKVKKA